MYMCATVVHQDWDQPAATLGGHDQHRQPRYGGTQEDESKITREQVVITTELSRGNIVFVIVGNVNVWCFKYDKYREEGEMKTNEEQLLYLQSTRVIFYPQIL